MNHLMTLLHPPMFTDEVQTLRARALHTLLVYMFVASLVIGVAGVVFIFDEKVITTAVLSFSLLFMGLGLFFNQRGNTILVARLVFGALWLATTFLVILSQGTRSLDMMFYISGTVGVGLILGTGSALLYAGITLFLMLVLAVLSQTGLVVLPDIFPIPPLDGWLLLLINVIFTVVPLNIVHKTLANALDLARIEIGERGQVEENLRAREAILEAVAFAAEQFLKSSDWRENIDDVLAQLGQSINASHAYIFEHHRGPDGDEVSSIQYEWTAPGQRSDLDDPLYPNSPLKSDIFSRFYEAMRQGLPMVSDKSTLSEAEAEYLHERGGILALLDVPIWVNGRWWGTIGFDDCEIARVWQPVEIDALRVAANVLSAAVERQEADAALRLSEERYRLVSTASSDYTFSSMVDESGELHSDWVAGAFERITGYEVEEFIARGEWPTILYPEDVERDTQALAQLQQNQQVVNEVRIIRKDGVVRWVRVYAHPVWDEGVGQLVGIYGAVQDITEHKQTEEALQASEEKFAKAFRASPDAIIISRLNADSQFVDVNDGFLRLSGYTREEVLHHPIQELNIWPDPGERERVVQRLIENDRVVNEEFTLQTKAGEKRYCLLSAERIEIGGEPYAVFVARDITERKRMEEALRLSEEKFSKAFHSSPDIIIITAVDEGVGYIDVNDSFVRVTGYSREEAMMRTRDFGILPLPERRRLVQMLRENGYIANEDTFIQTKSGELRDAVLSAQPIVIDGEACVVVIIRDNTERKQFEKLLARERMLLRTVIDTLPDYIYLKDTEHRCLVSNVANAHSLGVARPEDVEGRTLFDFYPAEEAEAYNDKDKSIIESGVAILNEENKFVDLETNQRRWTWMSRIPFRDSDGRILGVVGISRDITAFKEAELDRERLIEELQIKNAELERFTYTVSHDLKTPLVTISGFLGYLEKDVTLGNIDRIRRDINTIRDAVEQMKLLLQDLLELSRIGRIVNPSAEVSFNVLAREALNMISIHLTEMEIETVVAADMPVVYVDYLRLVEVVQNLLENAVKFMGNQSQPRIEIGTRGQDEMGYVIFFVKDNGIGIDPQYHEQIFELFQRLDQGVEGTGIGLALVKRIIETHGGRIWVESAVGKGATFCFTLPVKELI